MEFLGYSNSNKAYIVFNKKSLIVEVSIHIIFDEKNLDLPRMKGIDEGIDRLESLSLDPLVANKKTCHTCDLPKEWKYASSHRKKLIMEDSSHGVRTKSAFREGIVNLFLSLM